MGCIIPVSLLFHIAIAIATISLTNAQICLNTGNFTGNNNTYAKNRDLVLSSLASNVTANDGFYNVIIGQDNDTVYGLVLCISEPSAEDCSSCVNSAIQGLVAACPNQKEAITWGGNPVPCIVRYANYPFFGILELSPTDGPGYNTVNIDTNLTEFDQIWTSLMADTVRRASTGSSKLKLAAGEADLPFSRRIYVLMQCTPDITQGNCSYCLQVSVTEFRNCCFGKQGGYVQKPNCFFRWDLFPFYNIFPEVPTSAPPLHTNPSSPTNTTVRNGKRSTTSGRVVIIIVPSFSFLAVVILFCSVFYCRKSMQDVKDYDQKSSTDCLQFRFATIRLATNNFSDDNKLGQGGFGAVYKGLLPDGQVIAVKRLSGNSEQGEVEFKNEVLLVAKLQHRNLVRLLGFCVEGIERLLIYEFMPNSSLDRFIFDQNKRLLINWEIRYKIMVGIARGLLYLHQDSQLRIIHRDLKASNILLDEHMNAKISDFGLARLIQMDQTRHLTTRIVGTFGYMAPEYAIHGHFSVKSDVFSFGVLVLEIITGRSSSSNYEDVQEHLLTRVWEGWNQGTRLHLVDPVLLGTASGDLLVRFIHIGLLCVQENVAERPTMDSVILMLSSSSAILSVPSRPAYFLHSTMEQTSSTSTQDNYSSTTEQQQVQPPRGITSRITVSVSA